MKRADTLALENALLKKCIEFRTFGCPEVTVGWYGRHRVDFVQTNTKGIVWCYEIKVTESDFHSKHGHNFYGHYNYYVMTDDLYQKVKNEIPKNIGVLVGKALNCAKKARYVKISDTQANNMRMYLIRSLSREVKKHWNSNRVEYLMDLKRQIDYWKRLAYQRRGEAIYWKRRFYAEIQARRQGKGQVRPS